MKVDGLKRKLTSMLVLDVGNPMWGNKGRVAIRVMVSVPGVAGDGSRDLYHLIRSSLGIFRAKYDTTC